MAAPFPTPRCGTPINRVTPHDLGHGGAFEARRSGPPKPRHLRPFSRSGQGTKGPQRAPLYAALLLAACLPLHVSAQDRDTPTRRYTPPSRIAWELTVLTDGKQTDKLAGNTAVGQSTTVTRHWDVRHTVGCEGAETQPIAFSRTLTLSPLGVDSHQVIGFAVDTQETIDDDSSQTVRSDGCALPPTPRIITAHHPEWDLTAGQTVSWTIVPHHPTLVYQLTAHVIGTGAGAAPTPASGATASAGASAAAASVAAPTTDDSGSPVGAAASAAPTTASGADAKAATGATGATTATSPSGSASGSAGR